MVDNHNKNQRSYNMRRVRSHNTNPELQVRKMLHRMGLRFRLHRKQLPGCPDIVLVSRRVAIFVHGCFWHGHDCKRGKPPSSNRDFWIPKLLRNKERDNKNIIALTKLGWHSMVIWECELRTPYKLEAKVTKELALESRFESISGTK
jgi:DNA mismatch endonuclease, patch repair protein